MNPFLFNEYFTDGDLVTITLVNNLTIEAEIIDITDSCVVVKSETEVSLIQIEQIVFAQRSGRKLQSTNQHRIVEPNYLSPKEVEIANLAVQFHLYDDIESLIEFYERNKQLIDSNDYLTKLYREKHEQL